MKRFIQISLIFCLFPLAFPFAGSAQTLLFEMEEILDMQLFNFQDLEDNISVLPDHIYGSINELDSKGDEIHELNKDYQYSLKMGSDIVAEFQNKMDNFEAACWHLLEEVCPGQEKAIQKIIDRVEPLIELADEPIWILEGLDNRYDEKLLLKTFDKAEKACEKMVEEIEDLMEMVSQLEGTCLDEEAELEE